MSDNVVRLDDRRPPVTPPNRACTACGGEWWDVAVVLAQGSRVVGHATQIKCRDCGNEERLEPWT